MLKQMSRPEQIRQSVKEWLKTGDNCVPDKLKDLLQYRIDPPRLQLVGGRFVERYEDGSLTLHLHLSKPVSHGGGIERHRDVPVYCAVSQFGISDDHFHHGTLTALPFGDGITRDSGSQVECPVLVDVVKFVEDSSALSHL